MRLLKWLLILAGAAAVLVVGGTFVYINFIRDDPPPPLSFDERDEELESSDTTVASGTDTTVASETPAAEGVDGTWTVTTGSEAGYRATEVLFGQDATAVGRTTGVTGTIEIEGTTVTSATFEVDMTTLASDEDRRDGQVHSRILETGTFPTSTFALTEPLDFGELPADGESITVPGTGDLTVHGVTNSVTIDFEARLNGGNIEVLGSVPIVWADYDINDPSGGPAQVEDDGTMEFLVVLARS